MSGVVDFGKKREGKSVSLITTYTYHTNIRLSFRSGTDSCTRLNLGTCTIIFWEVWLFVFLEFDLLFFSVSIYGCDSSLSKISWIISTKLPVNIYENFVFLFCISELLLYLLYFKSWLSMLVLFFKLPTRKVSSYLPCFFSQSLDFLVVFNGLDLLFFYVTPFFFAFQSSWASWYFLLQYRDLKTFLTSFSSRIFHKCLYWRFI